MRIDVVMPQMGESIAEGTITRWLKKVGDTVNADEPIFEISTDKVDAEIPSPAAGTLVEIKGQEGDTVEVNAVVAVIETVEGAEAPAPAAAKEPEAKAPAAPEPAAAPPPPAAPVPAPAPAPVAATTAPSDGRFVSPVVRKIAAEHRLDPGQIPGTGAGGRVTKKDILAFIEAGGRTAPAGAAPAAVKIPRAAQTTQPDAPAFAGDEPTVRLPMTEMRKKISEHMIVSRRTSAHVSSVFEVDMTHAIELRARHKQRYAEQHGASLTYMAFFVKAVCDAARAWPIINASVEDEEIVYRRDLNIGIAVALDAGLIVPVIKHADRHSIAGLCQHVADLAERSRTKKLNFDDVQGGTFTITNPGQFGGLYGLPIINQPQVAILGIGGIEKRPVVINDAIAIRSMMYMTMSYDHRVVDGAVADQFLARVKHTLENFDEALL
jgi:2-oxoglutarate dehydrogenase E2 component (dihydrolipoamide succinyltransferase)